MKRLGQAAAGTGSGTLLYTTPTGYRCDVKDITIANTSASTIDFRLHLVPVGGSASTANAMFYDVTVAGNTTVQWFGHQILNAAISYRSLVVPLESP